MLLVDFLERLFQELQVHHPVLRKREEKRLLAELDVLNLASPEGVFQGRPHLELAKRWVCETSRVSHFDDLVSEEASTPQSADRLDRSSQSLRTTQRHVSWGLRVRRARCRKLLQSSQAHRPRLVKTNEFFAMLVVCFGGRPQGPFGLSQFSVANRLSGLILFTGSNRTRRPSSTGT